MNPHRLHTLDIPRNPPVPLNPQPIPRVRLFRPQPDTGRAMQLVLAGFFALLLVVWVLGEYHYRGMPATAPVHTPTVQVYELPAVISIEEARIEGFRAGMATAAAEGCPATELSLPIAAR